MAPTTAPVETSSKATDTSRLGSKPMIEALIVGLVASSSLLLAAAIAIVHQVQERTLGLVMAFGAGVLISAVAYDLVATVGFALAFLIATVEQSG